MNDENGLLAHNNKANVEILAKYFSAPLNYDELTELLDLDNNTPITTPPENINPPQLKKFTKHWMR